MLTYPFNVDVPSSLTKKKYPWSFLTEKAREIENYINERCKDTPETVFFYSDIASDLRIDEKLVKAFLQPLGGGHNGVTIYNHQLNGK